MSYHVYISHPGFKNEPISAESWDQALSDVVAGDGHLELVEPSNSNTDQPDKTLRFRKNRRRQLSRTVYGLGHAQDPDKPLIEVMFKVADRLGASVYSERNKSYGSPEDWESRTANFRSRQDERRKKARKKQVLHRVLWAAVVVIGGVVGYMIG